MGEMVEFESEDLAEIDALAVRAGATIDRRHFITNSIRAAGFVLPAVVVTAVPIEALAGGSRRPPIGTVPPVTRPPVNGKPDWRD